jgi:hypothetical protein
MRHHTRAYWVELDVQKTCEQIRLGLHQAGAKGVIVKSWRSQAAHRVKHAVDRRTASPARALPIAQK